MILALILFILTYILMLTLPKYRIYVVLAFALMFIILGILPISKIFTSIDWNALMI